MIWSWISKKLVKTPYAWRFKDNFSRLEKFPGSGTYWNKRYQTGGTSGAGSYGHLAQFKADFLNKFVVDYAIQSVIEFGCGDGAQLALAKYPKYIGLDVSTIAVQTCIAKFTGDRSKSFFLYDGDCFLDNQKVYRCDLALSLDVIYHLIEDSVFERYMQNLFEVTNRFVIIYSSNHEEIIPNAHVRHRKFDDYVATHFLEYSLFDQVKQKYPINTYGEQGSFANFYVYRKAGA